MSMSISQPSAICIVCHNAIFLLHHTIYLFFSVTERLLVTVHTPLSRNIQAKIPLPQTIWNEFYLFFSVTERLLVTVNGVNSNDYFFIFPLHTYAVHEGLLLQRYISPDAQAGSDLSAEILQIPDQIPDLLPDRMS